MRRVFCAAGVKSCCYFGLRTWLVFGNSEAKPRSGVASGSLK